MTQGCARFPEFVQNFSECQTLWSLCSVDFHTFTLQLPIQTLNSVAPELHYVLQRYLLRARQILIQIKMDLTIMFRSGLMYLD